MSQTNEFEEMELSVTAITPEAALCDFGGDEAVMEEKYKLIKDINVAMNRCAFTARAGSVIKVTQKDSINRKVLIHFGRDVGWFHVSWLERNAGSLQDT